jgi:hypothetical protein
MTPKKGSLIRRLAQERRDKPEESAAGQTGVPLTLSLGGLLEVEKPALEVVSEPALPVSPAPPKVEVPAIDAEGPQPLPAPAPEATVGKGSSAPVEPPAHAEPHAEKRAAGPRLGRVPGRHRKRHGEVCVRHPGEEKRSAGARAWLTPEESEKLELLATAYQISTSTLTRDIILEGLAAHSELIEKTRRFLDSLGKGRASA